MSEPQQSTGASSPVTTNANNAGESRSVELTREHRHEAVVALIDSTPELCSALLRARLLPESALDDPEKTPLEAIADQLQALGAGEVERILFQDPFVCDACGQKSASSSSSPSSLPGEVHSRVCPVDNKPHRRLLIEVATRFLGLVSEARAAVVLTQKDPTPAVPAASPISPSGPSEFPPPVPPAAAAAAGNNSNKAQDDGEAGSSAASPTTPQPGAAKPKVRRGLVRNPTHNRFLVLAFHCASKPEVAPPEGSPDAMLHQQALELICSMVDIFRAVHSIKKNDNDNEGAAADEKAAADQHRKLRTLLRVFERHWRQYCALTLKGMIAQEEQRRAQQREMMKMMQQQQQREQEGGEPPATPPQQQQQPSSASASASTATAAAAAAVSVQAANQIKLNSDDSSLRARSPPADRDPSVNSRNGSGGDTDDGGASATPEPRIVRPVAPPFGTRGGSVSTDEESDSDHHHRRGRGGSDSAAAAAAASSMGIPPQMMQQLSPEQQRQLTMNMLLEQKRRGDEAAAREAWNSKIRMRQQNAFEGGQEVMRQALETVSEEVESSVFLEELNRRPPNLQRIPYLLRRTCETLVGIIPSARVRAQLEKELADLLDWEMLKKSSIEGVERTATFLIGKVIELGAPAREEALKAELDGIVSRLRSQQENPGYVIVDAFRFLKSSVKMLQEDIHQAQLAMVRPELAKRALQLQRHYLDAWMQPPPSWMPGTKAWCKKYLIDDQQAGDGQRKSQEDEKEQQQEQEQQQQQHPRWDSHVKPQLLKGIVDLLRSSGRPAGTPRWADYPSELLFFEKPAIFTSANALQQIVCRMMVVGTARQLLATYKGCTPAAILNFESKLDKILVEMLTSQTKRMSLSSLKDEIEGELQFFVNNCGERAAAAASGEEAPVQMLKPDHVVQLRGVLDRMVDVNGSLYALFEKKILKCVESLALKELHKRAVSRGSAVSEDTEHRQENADELRALGAHVGSDVSKMILDLVDVTEHNVNVYSTRYEFMLMKPEGFLATPEHPARPVPAVAAVAAAAAAASSKE